MRRLTLVTMVVAMVGSGCVTAFYDSEPSSSTGRSLVAGSKGFIILSSKVWKCNSGQKSQCKPVEVTTN
ncbi:MAG: hypothetical protein KTR25_06310 [Myxococcales bacterium]|nr:hypothetical protein [Myxococcales bacterium]